MRMLQFKGFANPIQDHRGSRRIASSENPLFPRVTSVIIIRRSFRSLPRAAADSLKDGFEPLPPQRTSSGNRLPTYNHNGAITMLNAGPLTRIARDHCRKAPRPRSRAFHCNARLAPLMKPRSDTGSHLAPLQL